jgi:uncharacterized SAM-binding protein YcdF (DUF218 family)
MLTLTVLIKRCLLLTLVGAGIFACSSSKEQPTRLLIYASAAMEAARRAGAERRAPDAFRRAENAFWQAQTFYQTKQFDESSRASIEARRFAEMAEVESEKFAILGSDRDFY